MSYGTEGDVVPFKGKKAAPFVKGGGRKKASATKTTKKKRGR